jgi:SAM-dependent methyltransferase
MSKFPCKACPVCRSPFSVYLRDTPAPRSKRDIPVIYCMDCGSFTTPSGYIEDDERLKIDAQWHLDVAERNRKWARNFLNAIRYKFPKVSSIIEIGCGTGTMLEVASTEFGMQVVGFDTNRHAINAGRSIHPGLDLRHDMWTAQSFEEKYDLIVCISVLEHLSHPMQLMLEISEYCKKHASLAFVSVPYFERDKWDLLLQTDPGGSPSSDFRLVDVHVIHFTKRGLVALAGNCGASSATYFPRGWQGHLIEFN